MLKLPFFNRQRYVVLKCYVANERLNEMAPMSLSSKLEPIKTDVGKNISFRTCYGHITGLKRSVTLPMWTEFRVVSQYEGKDETLYQLPTHIPNNDKPSVDFSHRHDPTYHSPDCYITKIISPWVVEEKTGVNWVVAHHIRNSTPMRIPSGINNFKYDHYTHIFNLVHKKPHEYFVPFKTPVLALYPMTDLPLHVETYYDPQRIDKLNEQASYHPYLRGSMLKLSRDSS